MKYYSTINMENLFRDRLCNLIDEGMEYPLITMEAGTGFGKSIAVNQYVNAKNKDYILMRLSHLDNIPEQFWLKYTKILTKISREAAVELEQLGFPYSNSEISSCMHVLAKHIDLKQDLCYILDGFHFITEPSILHFIEYLLLLEIDYVHIFLVSAHKHSLNMAPFHQADMVFGITKEDLCFTKNEIQEYLTQLQIEYDTSLINWIYNFSEGWAFAIKLVTFLLKNRTSSEDLQQKVLPTIFELMDTFAFKLYDQEHRNTLIALSYLHTIPIKLIMHITGLSFDKIITLGEINPFFRYEASTSTVELHKVYIRFLTSKRVNMAENIAEEIFLAIGEWYYENGYTYEALDFYKRSRNYDRVCQIIRDFKNKRLSRDMSVYLLKTIQRIPEEYKAKHIELPLYEALFHFNNNQLKEAQDILRNFERNLLKNKEYPDTEKLLGEMYLLLGLIRMFSKEIDYTDYFKLADSKLTETSVLFDHTYPLLEINHGLLCRSLDRQDIHNALKSIKDGLPYFTKLTNGCGAGFIELAYGEYEFLRGNHREAEKYLYDGLFLAKDHLQADIVLNIYFLLMRIGIARGNPDLALDYLDKIKNFNKNGKYPKRNYPLIDIAQGWISLKIGSSANIASWLIKDDIDPNDISKRNEGRNLTMYANWLLIVKQNPIEAIAYLDKLEKLFLERSLYTSLMYVYMLKYSAYKACGRDTEECFKIIELVYDHIKDCDMIMFVVENGTNSRSALTAYKKYKARKIPDEWTDRILTKSMTYSKYLNTFKLQYQKAMDCLPDTCLTKSEKALLDGLCYGLSRAEIAEENRISENTVKSQLKTIYNKLNATNQAEAVYIYTSIYLLDSIPNIPSIAMY